MKFLLMMPISIIRLIFQSVNLAMSQIWANKVRSLLTTVGIVIGIASVIAVIAALTGLKTKVVSDFETFGICNIYISPTKPNTGPLKHASWDIIRFKPEHFEDLLEHCPSVKHLTRESRFNTPIRSGDNAIESATIYAVDAVWIDINSREILMGRPFSLIDETQGRRVCLIDPLLRDKLHLNKNCIGEFITVNNNNYRIVGLIKENPSTGIFNTGRGENFEVIIPFMTRYKAHEQFFRVIAASKSPEISEEAKAEITFFLRQTRRLQPGDPNSFFVTTVEGHLKSFNELAAYITAVASGIVGISLLVGGVGIMNIMLVSVTERTREIGLRKAVGAKGSAILTQFLIEAVVLCCVGGVLGVGGGYVIIQAIQLIPNADLLDQAYIPGWAILMSFGFSAGVGIFFGMFPAIKASKLDPIEALRHE
ncbi:MAG: ABC transporter permease [Planctomycetes bacterium]|nr:ABC transporter permease [Planctomycetota bacterium]